MRDVRICLLDQATLNLNTTEAHFNNILWKHASNNDTAREEKQPNFYNIPTKRERERERHQKLKIYLILISQCFESNGIITIQHTILSNKLKKKNRKSKKGENPANITSHCRGEYCNLPMYDTKYGGRGKVSGLVTRCELNSE